MKKLSLTILSLAVLLFVHAHAFAVDTIPNTTVWFTSSTAAVGTAISLNALVYNNQTQDATVTVLYKTDPSTGSGQVIGSQTQLIAAQSAKTLVQPWVMPATPTVVTASITTALNKKKQSIPALLGTLGTVTVGPSITPIVTGISFPGSAQLSAWFGPFLSKVEAFRVKEAAGYAELRDKTKVAVGITQVKTPTKDTDGLPPLKFDSPVQYLTLVYATACAGFFGNAIIFYIGTVLILLLFIRFIVNLFV